MCPGLGEEHQEQLEFCMQVYAISK
jgi:hypothetical protein